MALGLDTTGASPDPHGAPPSSAHSSSVSPQTPNTTLAHKLRSMFIAAERVALTLLSVVVSIVVPEFASVMAVLGATFSFLLCIIGPVCAKVALGGGLRRGCGFWDAVLLVVAAGMAVWGTVCAFQSAEVEPL